MNENDRKRWVRGLFLEYEGRLLRYVMKFTNHEKASEIVQESFLKLMKVDDPSKLSGKELAWLFRVSRNRALDRLKKEKPMSQLKPGQDIPFESDSPEETLQRDQQISAATQMLKSLTPTQKEVIRLKFQEELSYKQISEITGHSVSHVGVILHESIKKLREQAQQSQNNSKAVKNERG